MTSRPPSVVDSSPSVDTERFDVTDPADDAVVGSAPRDGAAEVRAAIDQAAAGQPDWASRSAGARAEIMDAVAASLIHETEPLAAIITSEQGKPLREARAEVAYAAGFFTVAARECVRLDDETIPVPGKLAEVRHRPIGVAAAITPWNFPLAMLAKKTAAALAVGCSQLVKPAEQTPLSAMRLARIAVDSGVPVGVLGIVTGPPDVLGEAMFGDPRLRKVSFTGSTEVGRLLIARSAANIIPLSLELGGHAPMLVFDDADLGLAIDLAMTAKFRNGGQTCIAPNRFLVQAGIHDRFVEGLVERASALTSGRGGDDLDLGPLIDDAAVAKVQRHIDDAVSHGASVALGGGLRSIAGLADRFPEPTVLLQTGPKMQCWREETFGPVCPIRRFTSEDEAIELANASPYGLAGYVATGSCERGSRVASRLDCGIIGVNDGLPAVPDVPFGGVKQSGFGREGGRLGLQEYLEPITISRRT